jgi:hypothetical protein
MSIVAQQQLFSWKNIEKLGDLERLNLVLEYIPDEEIIGILEKERKNGRDKYPVEPMWNTILAGVIYQHISIESLRRELRRNGELRELCGLEGAAGIDAVPTSSAYSRFLTNLMSHEEEINNMFDNLVNKITELLPDFGEMLAIDGKAISSLANGKKKDKTKLKDRRSDVDADWGKKEYKGKNKDETNYKKVVSWFGYKLHLVVDANYELPVEYKVTKASAAEQPVAHEILDDLNEKHPEIIKRCTILTGDKGYDTINLNNELYDEYGIKPVIDIRNLWKDGEETHLLPGKENIVYNYKGDVFCVCPASGVQRTMAYGGFEKERGTLKYMCPAKSYGITCAGCKKCPVKKSIRVDINIDRRVFTPIARSSYTWKRMYKKRTSVERVNSRIDVSFGFEKHYIRGQVKMQVRCGLALCIMLTMAYGRIKEDQKHLMRSLVKAAS